ncbi:unnamed protein product, partial [Choristocarpus tenellus]
ALLWFLVCEFELEHTGSFTWFSSFAMNASNINKDHINDKQDLLMPMYREAAVALTLALLASTPTIAPAFLSGVLRQHPVPYFTIIPDLHHFPPSSHAACSHSVRSQPSYAVERNRVENTNDSNQSNLSLPPTSAAPPSSESFLSYFKTALNARRGLFVRLKEEKTDCYRLFHGAVEGCPGLTVDRYGKVILVQTFREPPIGFGPATVDELCLIARTFLGSPDLVPVWNDRRKKPHVEQGRERGGLGGHEERPHHLSSSHEPTKAALEVQEGSENGVKYSLSARHRGIDPLLFLDLRTARKWMMENCKDQEVLNLFSYTGGVGIVAAVGGASLVWNVDFASSGHAVGKRSLKLNFPSEEGGDGVVDSGVGECDSQWMKADVLPTIRALAGLPMQDYRQGRKGSGGRGGRGRGRGRRLGQVQQRGGRARGGGRGGGGLGEGEKVFAARQFDI